MGFTFMCTSSSLFDSLAPEPISLISFKRRYLLWFHLRDNLTLNEFFGESQGDFSIVLFVFWQLMTLDVTGNGVEKQISHSSITIWHKREKWPSGNTVYDWGRLTSLRSSDRMVLLFAFCFLPLLLKQLYRLNTRRL